ncbi:MAG: sigma-70 family RNA polymerase sigma factor [Chloroflexota bacterium]
MNDDITAVRSLKNGDISGLEMLVCRYQVKAIRAAYLIVREEQLAEDIVQETFLRIFKHIRRFDESRPFEPYLLRSVVNAALDMSQKSSKHEQISVGIDSVEDLIQQAISVENQVEFKALKLEIHQALGKLSPRQRTAIVMRYFLGMSEKEMAEDLNTAPGTIKWLLNAARERLRWLLSGRSAE